MPAQSQKPIVFLAFANDRDSSVSYLRNLPEEARRLREIFEQAQEKGLCEVVLRQNATLDEILNVFQNAKYRNHIAIFHYGGHANGYQLLLETAAGLPAAVHAGGLAAFLGQQTGLELVFLNGCSTQQQVQGLLDAGVSSVIATAQAIDDQVATGFATRFYTALVSGTTIRTAFTEAEAALKTAKGNEPRNLYYVGAQTEVADRWPWELYTMPERGGAKAWQLATAANDPYFGLPDLPQDIGLPDTPFLGLNRFERHHARIFFGRGWVIRELFLHLTQPESDPLFLFYGQTGVGKSSLLEAGLLPRLEQGHTVIYQRRTPSEGLPGGLNKALGVACCDGAGLREAWRTREATGGRPLTILLDQAEEAFTQPYTGEPWTVATPPDATPAQAEVAVLMAAVYAILADSATRPQGKLILSFRKEHLAEIMDAVESAGIPNTAYFLKPLDRPGIQEAVVGVASGRGPGAERLRAKYKLEIEDAEQLATMIANDLLADTESPIAVTLQILLTEMWQAAVEQDRSRPRFSEVLYHERHKAGLLLNNFLDRQLAQVAEQFLGPSESGLVLDLLYHHTTDLGTAQEHTKDELVALYPHRAEVLPVLLQSLTDSYLLVDASGDRAARTGIVRLAHDTLAPLVRRRFERSPLPGQRAHRLLVSRVGTPDNPRLDPAPLDDGDLQLVEAGQAGMRSWHANEQALVQRSQAARERRRRNRRRWQWAGITALSMIVLLGIASGLLGIRANQEADRAEAEAINAGIAREDALHAQATAEAEAENALHAQATAVANEAEAEREARRARAGELAAHAQAEMDTLGNANDLALLLARDAVLTTWLPDGYVLARADTTLFEALKRSRWRMTLPRDRHEGLITRLAYSPDGSHIVSGSDDSTVRIWDAATGELLNTLEGHSGRVYAVAYSPDGSRIVSGSDDNTMRIWDAVTGVLLNTLEGHTSLVNDVAYSPDGSRIVSGGWDNTVRIWDAASGELLNTLAGHTDWVLSVAYGPDGSHIVSGGGDQTVRLWDAVSGELLTTLEGHTSSVLSVAYSPDGSHIVSGGGDQTVRLWEAMSGKLLTTLEGHTGGVSAVAYSPDGSHIVSGSDDSTVRLWDAVSGEQLTTLEGHTGGVYAVAYSPDGSRIVSGGDTTARIWDAVSGEQLTTLEGHTGGVYAVTYSPDSSRIASGGLDGTVRIWDDVSGELLTTLEGHTGGVYAVAYSPDSSRIASGGGDSTVRIWDAASGELLNTLHADWVLSVAYSADGSHIVSGSGDQTVRIWDAVSGEQLTTLQGHSGRVFAVAYSPDGSRIVSGSDDMTARIWDAASGELLTTLQGHTSLVNAVTYSPDGSRIVSGGWDNTVRIWDAASGELLNTLEGHTDFVYDVTYSPDGSRIVSGGGDQTVRLWDAVSGEQLTTLEGHTGSVLSVAYSPDGSHIVSGGGDQTVRLWDAESGELLTTLEGHTGSVRSVAYSPDGSHIVSGGGDQTARIWDAVSGELLTTLEGHTGGVYAVAYSPDGSHIVSGGDTTARIWDAVSGEQLTTLQGHRDRVYAVAYSPDSSRIVSGGLDQTVYIWDAVSGEQLTTLHAGFVNDVTYSPDGSRIVSGSDDSTVRLWDAVSGELLTTFQGHTGRVFAVAYSPDGSRIVSGSDDSTVRIWDAASGELLTTLEGHTSYVLSVAYSPDGSRIVSGAVDQTVRIWDAVTGVLLTTLEGHTGGVSAVAYSPDGSHIVSGGDTTARIWMACVEDRLQLAEARIQRPAHVLNQDERRAYSLEEAPVYTSASWREAPPEHLCPRMDTPP